MIYSDKLKEQAKEVYPNYSHLHNLLEEGSVMTGRVLDDSKDIGNTVQMEIYKLWIKEYKVYEEGAMKKMKIIKS
jgi:hypothetical protein